MIEKELTSTYEEQIARYQQQLQRLRAQCVAAQERNDRLVAEFNEETQRLVQAEQERTAQQLQSLQSTYNQLVQDQEALKLLQEAELRQCNDRYDTELNMLELDLGRASEQADGRPLSDLQETQQRLVSEQRELVRELNHKKEQL